MIFIKTFLLMTIKSEQVTKDIFENSYIYNKLNTNLLELSRVIFLDVPHDFSDDSSST
jgi:hypothetical protein